MRTAIIAAALVLAAATGVAAEPAAPQAAAPGTGTRDAGATPMTNDAVFQAFHGRPGIDRIVDDLIRRNQADPRVTDIFKGPDLVHLRAQLSDYFCYVLGGPCTYGGKDMRTAHKDMGLQDADLNALIENLQAAMDKEGVPFRAQNKLLAKLAPMRRLVVVR